MCLFHFELKEKVTIIVSTMLILLKRVPPILLLSVPKTDPIRKGLIHHLVRSHWISSSIVMGFCCFSFASDLDIVVSKESHIYCHCLAMKDEPACWSPLLVWPKKL